MRNLEATQTQRISANRQSVSGQSALERSGFSIQVFFDGVPRGKVVEWIHTDRPILLGQPARFSLERTADTDRIRIRDLKVSAAKTLTVEISKLMNGRSEAALEVELSEMGSTTKGITLKISRHVALENPFQRMRDQSDMILTKPHTLAVYQYEFGHLVKMLPLFESITIKSGNISVLKVSPVSKGQYEIRPLVQPMTYRNAEESHSVVITQKMKFSASQLLQMEVFYEGSHFKFSAVPYVKAPSYLTKRPPTVELSEKIWKKSIGSSLGLSLAILLALFLIPKPEVKVENTEEVLIPIQVAKIILSKPKADAAAPAQAERAKTATKPANVANTAVVQAFRSKALQNSVKGLLKGGVTQLLAQSDLVAGVSKDSSQKLFGSKNAAIGTNVASGISDPNVSKVAAIGGKGEPGSVGYGTGEKAKVNGQGSSQVSLDIGASSVQEGLTKDEVGRVIHQHLSEVRYCYESAMLQSPDIQGKLTVAFTIAASGVVKTASVANSTVGEARLEDCLIRRLMTWKFPQPKGGVTVDVSYPFIFKTLGR